MTPRHPLLREQDARQERAVLDRETAVDVPELGDEDFFDDVRFAGSCPHEGGES